jgi:hypothetical protein
MSRRRRSLLGWIRYRVYKHGFRPKWGAILYSPSMDLSYSIHDHLLKGMTASYTDRQGNPVQIRMDEEGEK